jgi:hypothetical protein
MPEQEVQTAVRAKIKEVAYKEIAHRTSIGGYSTCGLNTTLLVVFPFEGKDVGGAITLCGTLGFKGGEEVELRYTLGKVRARNPEKRRRIKVEEIECNYFSIYPSNVYIYPDEIS